ncbi:hypothetical protein VTK73DRAFT_8915 [Phialemonium thermophilum]|uniref:WW domain-containing protein n=1 Tax=Phialemonium thermophilum TaxID=223376 RepID=A0ABR3W5L1_9PEZI
MKSTLARLKHLVFRGGEEKWVKRIAEAYVAHVKEESPKLSRKLEKLRYAKLHGAPHETPETGDPYHASVALRKRDDYKGSGLSLHIYPNGLVKPSKAEFPTIQITLPAEEDQPGSSSKGKQNEQAQAGSSHQSSSKHHKSSEKGKGKGKESGGGGYQWDPSSGHYYRYDEHGRLIYWDPDTQEEYMG